MRIKFFIAILAFLIIGYGCLYKENQKMLNPTSCLFWLMTWVGPI
jgi:hypothetical protein